MRSWPLFLHIFACITAALSVLIAAYAAHMGGLDDAAKHSINWAIQMMQFHALALLVVAWTSKDKDFSRRLVLSLTCFVLGIVLFSFNIIANHLMGLVFLKPLVPWGGMAFVLGWLLLAMAGMKAIRMY